LSFVFPFLFPLSAHLLHLLPLLSSSSASLYITPPPPYSSSSSSLPVLTFSLLSTHFFKYSSQHNCGLRAWKVGFLFQYASCH
jgi:hypothetical protein